MADMTDMTNTIPMTQPTPPNPEIHTYGPVRTSPAGYPNSVQVRRPDQVPIPYANPPEEVTTLSLHDQGSVYASSRVMSPIDQSNAVIEAYGANQSLVLGLQCQCMVCQQMVPEPSMCANCGIHGHAVCIMIEQFQGYAFCHQCFGDAVASFASMRDTQLRQEWQHTIQAKMLTWRECARNAVGASASIGISVGGAAATVAGAALAVAHGFAQGVSSVTSGGGIQAALPPPPLANPTFSRPLKLRRSNSIGELTVSAFGDREPCPRCDLTDTRVAHT